MYRIANSLNDDARPLVATFRSARMNSASNNHLIEIKFKDIIEHPDTLHYYTLFITRLSTLNPVHLNRLFFVTEVGRYKRLPAEDKPIQAETIINKYFENGNG